MSLPPHFHRLPNKLVSCPEPPTIAGISPWIRFMDLPSTPEPRTPFLLWGCLQLCGPWRLCLKNQLPVRHPPSGAFLFFKTPCHQKNYSVLSLVFPSPIQNKVTSISDTLTFWEIPSTFLLHWELLKKPPVGWDGGELPVSELLSPGGKPGHFPSFKFPLCGGGGNNVERIRENNAPEAGERPGWIHWVSTTPNSGERNPRLTHN